MAGSVEFFFDYGSPYSYLADTQLEGLRRRSGAEIVYRPMLLGGVFKAIGNSSPIAEPIESKRRYFSIELRRWVDHLGVAFRSNPFFPIDTLLLMRTCVAARQRGVFADLHRVVYPAFWAEARNLGDPEVIAEVLDRAGLEGKALLDAAVEPEVKRELRATTEEAVERGTFGAPTFFVGEEMFFGADRLAFVERALEASGALDASGS